MVRSVLKWVVNLFLIAVTAVAILFCLGFTATLLSQKYVHLSDTKSLVVACLMCALALYLVVKIVVRILRAD